MVMCCGEDGHVLRRSLDFDVEGQRKKGKLNRTLKKQVEEGSMKVGLSSEDEHYRSRWIVGINLIVTRLR